MLQIVFDGLFVVLLAGKRSSSKVNKTRNNQMFSFSQLLPFKKEALQRSGCAARRRVSKHGGKTGSVRNWVVVLLEFV